MADLHTDGDHKRDEKRVRWFGTGCLTLGILTIPVAYLSFLSVEVVTHDTTGLIFTLLKILTLALAGTALIILGGMERLHRPVRKRQRRNAAVVEQRLEEISGRVDELLVLIAAVPDRLNAVEVGVGELERSVHERCNKIDSVIATVPDYSQAVLEGIELRRNVVGPDGI